MGTFVRLFSLVSLLVSIKGAVIRQNLRAQVARKTPFSPVSAYRKKIRGGCFRANEDNLPLLWYFILRPPKGSVPGESGERRRRKWPPSEGRSGLKWHNVGPEPFKRYLSKRPTCATVSLGPGAAPAGPRGEQKWSGPRRASWRPATRRSCARGPRAGAKRRGPREGRLPGKKDKGS